MGAGDLPAIAAAMAAAGIERLELTGPGCRLVLVRGGGSDSSADANGPAAAPATIAIVAPGPGTLLLAHPLHDHPLAAAGERVRAGQPVAVVRVGALLLPVVAPAAGVIGEAAVMEGALVGYGDRLFDLRPED